MNRETAYQSMLETAGKMQFNISLLLEAKALEAEKTKNWYCNHLFSSNFNNHQEQLLQAIDIHQQIVAVIEGLTKMESGLGKNLKVVLRHNESGASSGFDGGSGTIGIGGFS